MSANNIRQAKLYAVHAGLVFTRWARYVQKNPHPSRAKHRPLPFPAEFRELLIKSASFSPEVAASFLHLWLAQWNLLGAQHHTTTQQSKIEEHCMEGNHYFQKIFHLTTDAPYIQHPGMYWLLGLLHLGLLPSQSGNADLSAAANYLSYAKSLKESQAATDAGVFSPLFFSHMEQTLWRTVQERENIDIDRLQVEVLALEAGLMTPWEKEANAESTCFIEGRSAVMVSALMSRALDIHPYHFARLPTSIHSFVNNLGSMVAMLLELPQLTNSEGLLAKLSTIAEQAQHVPAPLMRRIMYGVAALGMLQISDSKRMTDEAARLYLQATKEGAYLGLSERFLTQLQRHRSHRLISELYRVKSQYLQKFRLNYVDELHRALVMEEIKLTHLLEDEHNLLAKEHDNALTRQNDSPLAPPQPSYNRSLPTSRRGNLKKIRKPQKRIHRAASADIVKGRGKQECALSNSCSELDLSRLQLISPIPSLSPQSSIVSISSLPASPHSLSTHSLAPSPEHVIDDDWSLVKPKRLKIATIEEAPNEALDPRLHWNWSDEIRRVWKVALAYRNQELFTDPNTEIDLDTSYGQSEQMVLDSGLQWLNGHHGIEVLYEERAWTIMHRLDDMTIPWLHSQKHYIEKRKALLQEAREYLFRALEYKLKLNRDELDRRYKDLPLATFLDSIKRDVIQAGSAFNMPHYHYHFMKSVVYVLRSLGHCHSYLAEFGPLYHRMTNSQIAQAYFQMKSLCPPDPYDTSPFSASHLHAPQNITMASHPEEQIRPASLCIKKTTFGTIPVERQTEK
ncbi:hypothetical protein [Sansalvadorimonas verongulae]|uniref:hypothetical protein n=1 Tax=Sansalvadorimonas verongulae TaxID=2172824 RepID=UPI0012BB613B|nr:hypothetical protein [Sansalvadorimonas verongulae]MTI13599.1 hypothetical protein [Sansalvadorimonas verongulae]